MKADDHDLNLTITSFISTQKIQVNCINGQKAVYACSQENCDMNAFLCLDQNCKCKQYHTKCFSQSSIRNVQKILSSKLENLKQISKIVQKQILKVVDQLSSFQQKIQMDILQYGGFSQAQIFLKKVLQCGQVHQVKGNDIFLNQESIKQSNKKLHQISQREIAKCCDSLKNQVMDFKQRINHILFKNQQKTLIKQFKDSSILKSNEDITKLTNFFNENIKRADLLYRATRDSFKASKFHEHCDNIPDTLTIIQTTTDKIFGGYTPAIWTSGKGQWGSDKELKSFLFQLNNNDKFTLKPLKAQNTIQRFQTYGPIFGYGGDIVIHDDSDISQSSWAKIGSGFQNSSYICEDFDSKIRFSGGHHFKVKDYEVWKITFN